MTAIPLTVLPTSGFPSTVKPTTASIKIDWWMFVSFGTSFFGYYCSGFSRCGFATHGFPMCGPSICDSFRSDTTKKQAHMRIAVVPAVHIWALIVDFWLHPHRCFSCHSLCKVVIKPVFDAGNIAVCAVGVDGVKVVVDGNIPHIVLRKSEIDIKPGQWGISSQSG